MERSADNLPAALGKAHQGALHAVGAFQTTARPLLAGAVGRQASGLVPGVAALGEAAAGTLTASNYMTLAELAEGPYFVIAMQLDAGALCRADATCRLIRALNRAQVGPWRSLGARAFYGLELDRDGVFELVERDSDASEEPYGSGRKHARVDWKGRYSRFWIEVPSFRAPFGGTEITSVSHPDEVAYCRCRLRTDLLDSISENGVYLEVEVVANPDNLSLAVVDFEAGGRSSVTFSPDTGAVIRERKVREAPRKVEGSYIQPLSNTPAGQKFEGLMGVYLYRGHLAFFRRCILKGIQGDVETRSWESTGFITDLAWAEGRCLTPCLAFRDEGAYRVRVVGVGSRPPLPPEQTAMAYDDSSWSGLDWEAGQSTPPEV